MTRTPLAAALLGALLLTAGCGGDPGGSSAERPRGAARVQVPEAGRTAPATPPTAPPATPRDEPTAERPDRERRVVARPVPPTPSGNALSVRGWSVDGHLLRPGDLGERWSVTGTTREAGRVMSTCHRATLHDVGAQETRLRDFAGPDGMSAVQAVSRFVDGRSAWRIEQVVASWAADCADDLRARDAALGAVRHGSWVSVVEVAGADQPRRQLRSALAAVAATF